MGEGDDGKEITYGVLERKVRAQLAEEKTLVPNKLDDLVAKEEVMAPDDNHMVLASWLKWGLTLAVDTLLPQSKRIEKLFLCSMPCGQIDSKMNESICGSQTKLT
jgi:hypothetical protein